MSASLERLVAACLIVLTSLVTLAVSFAAALTIISVLDEPEGDEAGFFLAIGTLNGQHALLALGCAGAILLLVWLWTWLYVSRGRSPQERAAEHR